MRIRNQIVAALAAVTPVVVLLLASVLAEPNNQVPVTAQRNVVIVNPKPQVRQHSAGEEPSEVTTSTDSGSTSVAQSDQSSDRKLADAQQRTPHDGTTNGVRLEEILPRASENVQGLKDVTGGKRRPMTPDIVMSQEAPVQKTRVRPARNTALLFSLSCLSHRLLLSVLPTLSSSVLLQASSPSSPPPSLPSSKFSSTPSPT